MKVLSAAEMHACDRATSERFGVPSIQLMRNAAQAVASFALERFPRARRVTVLCGRGNNGGDGAMTARLLAEAGLKVTVILLGSIADLKGDAHIAWKELHAAASSTVHVVEAAAQLDGLSEALSADLLIDAIVGTGFIPPLKGLALSALEWSSKSAAPILSIDLPSGWPADATAGRAENAAFPADAVVTFTAPKPAHLFGELTRHWAQPVVVAPIGSPDEAIVSELNITWAGGARSLYRAARKADSNKGNFGHVLVIGGTFGRAGGKAGAPAMTSMAAMRTGAGLVTAAVPAPALPIVAGFAPELMTQPLKANADGQIAAENLRGLESLTKGITTLAIGPGLGQGDDTAEFFFGMLERTRMPVVLDADGLNLLSKHPEVLQKLAAGHHTVVLTPHPGEMSRLAGISTAEVQADRLNVARRFAVKTNIHLVLKGARTLIAHPSGHVAVNTTGNPGMAKGGSGDLLTGMIAGLLAQFPHDAERAIEAAVYLHGLAADFAVREHDEHTLLATDTLPNFARAFQFDPRAASGYVWLQGLPAVDAAPEEECG
jgi:NAD(P)H-hydrate epimerase